MEEVFAKYLVSKEGQVEQGVGDPWEVIPIKNTKYAKDCIEIHLGNRGLTKLTRFEDFPNIERLWINDNKFENIRGLDTNFRLKELYAHNNKIKTLDGSLEKLGHLRMLELYNNELRNLDVIISKLKDLSYLESLDLFGNPLAEEPYYRLKIIYMIPQLKVFDRHKITTLERIKAENQMKELEKVLAKNAASLSDQWNSGKKDKLFERNIGDPMELVLKKMKPQMDPKKVTEMHMEARNIIELKNFECIPNLEALFLNGNKLTRVDNLEKNLWLKQLYLTSNQIFSLKGSIPQLKHLQVLNLAHNDLRGLDDVINQLKGLKELTHLDLTGNPVRNEANYRRRLILEIPSLLVLDGEAVTSAERTEAARVMREFGIDQMFKKLDDKEENKYKGYSLGERAAFKEAEQVKEKKLAESMRIIDPVSSETLRGGRNTMSGTRSMRTTVGSMDRTQGTLKSAGLSTIPGVKLSPYEIPMIVNLFINYDKAKSKTIDVENVKNLFEDLKRDAANIGIIPSQSSEEFMEMFKDTPPKSKVQWEVFREKLFVIPWMELPDDLASQKLTTFFADAQVFRNQGKEKEARDVLFKALRVQNRVTAREFAETVKPISGEDTLKAEIIMRQMKKKGDGRFDTFNFSTFKFRDKATPQGKEVL